MADHKERADGDAAKGKDAFPAQDPIAQFIVVMRAQRDDLAEAITQVVERAQSGDRKVHYYHRLLVSHYFEAMKWFTHAASVKEIAEWLNDFSEASTKSAIDAALASTKAGGLAKSMLWAGRQTTFHYPCVGVAVDGLQEGLEAIEEAPVELTLEENEYGLYPRTDFAEELFTYRLLHTFGNDVEERIAEVQQAALQYVRLADICFDRYMSERDLTFGPPRSAD
jgi:hypothetical protein